MTEHANKTMNARTQNKRNSEAPRTPEKVTGTCRDVRIDPLHETESKTGDAFSERSKSLSRKNFSKNSGLKGQAMSDYRGKCGNIRGVSEIKSCEFGA